MDLAGRIDQLEQMVRDAKAMPLSSSVLLNRDELLSLAGEMRAELPEEIKQAKWVVRDREELLTKARLDADALVEQAQAEQLRLAEQEEIVHRAHEEAGHILAQAQDEARAARLEAEAYVDRKLSEFEAVARQALEYLQKVEAGMGRTLAHVEQGRVKLRDPMATQLEAASAPAHPPEPFDEEAGT
ncbi:MAG: hypothetical protein WD004_03950 [Actinomycetota bacterium]